MSEKAFPLADAELTIALLDLVQQASGYKVSLLACLPCDMYHRLAYNLRVI